MRRTAPLLLRSTTTAVSRSSIQLRRIDQNLLIRDEDVQVLHGFDSAEHAQAYLSSAMFQNDVFVALKPLWSADPDVKIYTVA